MAGFERVVLDPRKLAELLRGREGPVYRYLLRAGDLLVNASREEAPKKSGRGARSIVKRVEDAGEGVRVVIVVGEEYMRFQHEGTGVYGPEGTPIVPKQASFLVWRSESGSLIFARSVQGVKPNPFITRAAKKLGIRVVRLKGG